jgi:FkbM family methyltransferase
MFSSLRRLRDRSKSLLQRVLIPEGTTVPILRGPLRGCRIVAGERTGWAPILGRWEPAAQELFCQLVRAGQVVYDLGANTGLHSLLFARLVGPGGRVHAFEPLPENVRAILAVRDLNHSWNLEIVERAVGEVTGRAAFKVGRHPKQGSLVGIGCETGQELEVQVTTLDEFMETSRSAPDFVKVDIEGAESAALRGFERGLTLLHPTLLIDLHTPDEDRAVGRALGRHGYRVFRVLDPTSRRMTGQTRLLHEVRSLEVGWPAPEGVWGTIVAVHPERGAVLDRCLRTR